MDLPWGDERSKRFISNIGLITSNGQYGHNIMACEWTRHVSYSPGYIMINIHRNDATFANINKTKEFGVNLCTENQSILSSVSGASSGKDVNKVGLLKDIGVEFYKANKIDCLMIKDALMNAECRVVKKFALGDHIAFIGEVLNACADKSSKPLIYYGGKYWRLDDNIKKPPVKELNKIKRLVEKHRK